MKGDFTNFSQNKTEQDYLDGAEKLKASELGSRLCSTFNGLQRHEPQPDMSVDKTLG